MKKDLSTMIQNQIIKRATQLTLIIIMCGFGMTAIGQKKIFDATTVALFKEIDAIQIMYGGGNRLSFTTTMYMEDITTDVELGTTVVKDTVVSNCKMSNNQFYIMSDSSIECVQNDKIMAAFYHDNKTVVLQKPSQGYKKVLQVDVNDAVFQQMAMQSMSVADSGRFKKLTIHFDSTALYTQYQVVYDSVSHLIANIRYTVRKNMEQPWSTSRVEIKIVFNDYAVNMFDDTVFSNSRFFTQYNSKDIRLETLYGDYEIVNLLDDK